MHNAGIGADVVDGLRLLGLIDVVVVEDIGEGQRLLRVRDWSACHDGQDGLEHTNKTEYRLDLGYERDKRRAAQHRREPEGDGRMRCLLSKAEARPRWMDGGAGIDGGAAVEGGGWGAAFREVSRH